MRTILYISIIALLAGCSTNSTNSFSELEEIEAYYEYDKQYKPVLSHKRSKLNKSIIEEIQTFVPEMTNIQGIGTWKYLEMDTSYIKPFNLSLLDGFLFDALTYILITSDKNTDSIIFCTIFNDSELSLIGVYPHSSEIDRDGIRVEFSRDMSTEDSIIIQKVHMEIPEKTGMQEIREISNDAEQTFYALSKNNALSGIYESQVDSVEIRLEMRDPQNQHSIPYKLIFKSPERCYTFLNDNYEEYENRSFNPDSNISITLNEYFATIKFDKWENHCEEIITYHAELKKVDNKVR